MDKYFKLPTGYACLQRNGDGVYAYTSNYQVRDQYEFDNFEYVKINTQTSNIGYNVSTCLPSTMTHLIPSSFAPSAFLGISMFVCLLISGIFYVFRR